MLSEALLCYVIISTFFMVTGISPSIGYYLDSPTLIHCWSTGRKFESSTSQHHFLHFTCILVFEWAVNKHTMFFISHCVLRWIPREKLFCKIRGLRNLTNAKLSNYLNTTKLFSKLHRLTKNPLLYPKNALERLYRAKCLIF